MSGTPTLRAALMVAALMVIGAVSLLAVAVDGRSAMYVFAGALAVFGIVRLCAPAEVVPTARSRTFDVVVYLGLAVAIGLLAPWGNAVLPASA